jgi:hypothetical protein
VFLSLPAVGQDRKSDVDPLLPVSIHHKWGYINWAGKLVIPARFPDASRFHHGRAMTTVRTKPHDEYGYISTTGRLAFPEHFSNAYDFTEDLAGVAIGSANGPRWGFINRSGKWVVPPKYKYVYPFSEDLAPVQDDSSRWGFIDRTGATVIPHQYVDVHWFKEGRAAVLIHGKYGFIDQKGNVVVPPRFSAAADFSDGLALVEVGENLFDLNPNRDVTRLFIDKAGNTIISLPKTITSVDAFSQGLAVVRTGRQGIYSGLCGYIDKGGKVVIPVEFENCSQFCQGVAAISINGVSRIVDGTGHTVNLNVTGYNVDDFCEGLAAITETGREGLGYIDRSGKVVWKPTK